MVSAKDIIHEHYAKLGSKAGRSLLKKHGKKYFQKLGKAGAKKRWKLSTTAQLTKASSALYSK